MAIIALKEMEEQAIEAGQFTRAEADAKHDELDRTSGMGLQLERVFITSDVKHAPITLHSFRCPTHLQELSMARASESERTPRLQRSLSLNT